MIKLQNLLFIFLLSVIGCKNPLDETGTGKSMIAEAYHALLDLPSNFSFTNYDMQSSQVTIYWGTSERADSYQVKYGTTSGAYTTTASCVSSPCIITGLTNGTTYYFTVTATNPKGTTSVSNELSITPINAPSIPSGVSATSSNGSVAISWSASTGSGIIKYKVLRSTTSGSGYSQLATDITATSYTDSTVNNNTTYYYVVRSFNEFGEGSISSEVIGTPMTPPAAPTGLSATSALNQLNLSWSAAVGSGTKTYTVYRSTTSGHGFTLLSANISDLTYTDTTATAGLTYYYYVTATNLGGVSSISDEVSGQAYQNFSLNIPFSTGSESNYTFSNSSVSEFTGGVFRLTPADQTDNDGTASGFGGSTFHGAQYDSTNGYVRLNTTTNHAELDASWTPQWGNIVGYWKFDGNTNDNSSYSNTSSVSGSVTYNSSNKIGSQGVMLDGSSAYITISNSPQLENIQENAFTILAWANLTSSSQNSWVIGKSGFHEGIYYEFSGSKYRIGCVLFSTNGIDVSVYSNYNYSINTFLHVGCVLDKANNFTGLYVNGNLVASKANVASANLREMGTVPWRVGTPDGSTGLFTGVIDDLAIWNTSLSASEIKTIFQRQSAKYSGQLQSRVMDAFTVQPWISFDFLTTLPFYKEIASSQESTISTEGYSGLNSSLNSDLAGLYHFDGNVTDYSGNNHNGTLFGSPSLVRSNAVFGTSLDPVNGYVTFGNWFDVSNRKPFAVSIWFFINRFGSWDRVFNLKPTSDASGRQDYMCYVNSTSNTLGCEVWVNNLYYTSLNKTNLKINTWYHLVLSSDGSTLRGYIDGIHIGSPTVPAINNIGNYLQVGPGNSNIYFDEFAVWNRTLSVSEISQLYRRGANRIKYQIRSCANSDCSDQEGLTLSYKGWKGPDNTGLTYFSELYNTVANSPSGDVQTGSPVMTFSNFSGSGLNVTDNRYFQYRAILESDDQNNLCNYGSGSTACSPELKSVTVGPSHYSTSNVYITSHLAIGSLFQTLSGFTTTLGSNNCSGDRYSISSDGSNFWYFNGSSWALSNGSYEQASSATQIHTNIDSLVAVMGVGTLQIRTFLNSDGVTPCEVDNVSVQGQKY